jgi:uncharacterized membrane protein
MPTELDLLRSLDDEPRTPSTVDVHRAIAVGRRRRARRAAGYAGAAAVTALAVAGVSVGGGLLSRTAPDAAAPVAAPKGPSSITSPPPTSCALERLPAPDNAPMALVSGADGSGRYVVGRSYPKGGGYQAVLWHDGKGRNVALPGNLQELLTDVNSTGTAVGWSYAGEGDDTAQVPYVYRDGEVSKLPGVPRGSAEAINDAGAIAGNDDRFGPVVWPSATAKPVRLPVPAGTSDAKATDIDEDGTTVGTLDNEIPYVWFPDGAHRALPMPNLDGKPAADARVFSIRNGWASGVADDGLARKGGVKAAAAQMETVRWNVRTGAISVADALTGVSTVNAQGWLVGTDKPGHAVLVAGTTPVVLPELVSRRPDGVSTIATTVSDDGRTIAGQSDDATDTIQAVVWRCH